jgi:Tti2 family
VLEYLSNHSPLESSLLSRILTDHVKPLFVATPHPMLNLETARKLTKPAAGAHSTADLYDYQPWKNNIGIANSLHFCVDQMDIYDFENRWPLFIPPIMTLSDDREGKWRLRILTTISKLLKKAPADLLRRTGIQDLLLTVSFPWNTRSFTDSRIQSLNNTLLFTGNPESAALVEHSVPVILNLITKTTRHGSEERFDQLCQLLGKGIIGSLWVYATRDLDSIRATYHAIPSVLELLGFGTIRYLKVKSWSAIRTTIDRTPNA